MPNRFPWVLVLVIALFAGFGHLRPVTDPDVPWHLQSAEMVLRHGASTYPDETSFTVPGRPFADHPWLGQMVLRAAFRAGGYAGLSIFAALCGFLASLAIAFAAWEYSERRPWATVLTTAIIVPIVAWRFEPRPLALFLIFLPIALVLARRFATSSGQRLFAYGAALVALQLLWLFVHGSFVLLPAVTTIALLASISRYGVVGALQRSALVIVQVGVILVIGDIAVHSKLISNVALGDATNYIIEMRPLTWRQLIPSHFNSILFLDLALLIGAVRSIRLRSVRPQDVLYVLLGLALAFTAHRFRAAWGLLCIPFLARPDNRQEESATMRWTALIAALITVPVVTMNDISRTPERGFGAGISRDAFPVDAVAFLEAYDVHGNVLNVYEDGGYLAFRLGPNVRIAIDGRTPTVFDDELYFLIREAKRNPQALKRFEQKYAPDMVLTKPTWAQCRMLRNNPNWRAVFLDFERRLFFREGFRSDIPRLPTLDPCASPASIAAACARNGAAAVRRDIAAMQSRVPLAPYPLLLASAVEGGCLGDGPAAVALAEKALASGTRRPDAWAAYARALAAAGATDEALGAADQAEAMGAGSDVRLLRAQVLQNAGRRDAAIETYAGLVDELHDQLPIDARMSYAEALAESGEWTKAKLHAQRVLWVSTSTRARLLLERAPAEQ